MLALLQRDRDQQRTPRTTNIRLSTLRTFYAYLARCGLLPEDALPTAGIRRLKEDRHLPRALPDADGRKLLAACDRRTFAGLRDYAMLVVVLDTGMRRKEAAQIRLEDIDTSTGVIRLCHELKDHKGARRLPLAPEQRGAKGVPVCR